MVNNYFDNLEVFFFVVIVVYGENICYVLFWEEERFILLL